MNYELNHRAAVLVEYLAESAEDCRIERQILPSGGQVFDCGIHTQGGLSAGLELADISLAGLADVTLTTADLAGTPWPHVEVATDHPVPACLFSQYAGWKLDVEGFFAMGSGPMRSAAAKEDLFSDLNYNEQCEATVGILECSELPGESVIEEVSQKTNCHPQDVVLMVAPTSSQAGNVQVIARSIETALHKLYETGFSLARIVSGYGLAPLPPVAGNDLEGIGRTNDAILYGGRVTLWVTGDDESLQQIGPTIPSNSSPAYGRSFATLFEEAGGDFYQIDPHLFSPAVITLQNIDTGRVHTFGQTDTGLLKQSFGL